MKREREWSGSFPEAEARDGDFALFWERERERERTVTPYDDSNRQSPVFHFWSFHFPVSPSTKKKKKKKKKESFNLSFILPCLILPDFPFDYPLSLLSLILQFLPPFRHLMTFRGSFNWVSNSSPLPGVCSSTFGKWKVPYFSILNCGCFRVFVFFPIPVRVFGFVRCFLASCMLGSDSVLVFIQGLLANWTTQTEFWIVGTTFLSLLIRFVPEFRIWSKLLIMFKEIHQREVAARSV